MSVVPRACAVALDPALRGVDVIPRRGYHVLAEVLLEVIERADVERVLGTEGLDAREQRLVGARHRLAGHGPAPVHDEEDGPRERRAALGIGDLGSVLGGINLPSGIDIPDIDLGVCGDACGSICEPVAGCLGPCLGSVGDVAGDAVGAIGDVAESAIDVVANVVESLT